jgi:hypothetical protein
VAVDGNTVDTIENAIDEINLSPTVSQGGVASNTTVLPVRR